MANNTVVSFVLLKSVVTMCMKHGHMKYNKKKIY